MSDEQTGYRLLNLVGFTIDATQPLALFREEEGGSTCPLWLALDDVIAITADLVSKQLPVKTDRKDFLDSLLEVMGLTASGIIVDGTLEEGYASRVCLAGEGRLLEVNVELATALLTAIRYKLQVQISEQALASSALVDKRVSPRDIGDDASRILGMLERLSPEDMGKYPI